VVLSNRSCAVPETGEVFSHSPVLLEAVVQALEPKLGGLFIDCTLGLGGHSEALLSAGPDVRVLGIDRDEEALSRATDRLSGFGDRFRAVQANFNSIKSVFEEGEFAGEPVRGILADLGVSSMQLEAAERGFSFMQEGPLDMRMDRREPTTAARLVNSLGQEELANLIYQYGEEPASRVIARRILEARTARPIETTTELAAIVARAVHSRSRGKGRSRGGRSRIHPATRTFQALRIAVNEELAGLESFVADAVSLLDPGGRLAVITFHSLEDRIIKNAFRFESGACRCPPGLPQCVCGARARVRVITKKPITADEQEIEENPRARSAKLRVSEKL
jgi:16S rRNA (cytosine1402-N4)-methyltransferase